MKLIFDLFPVILFFLSYHQADAIINNTPVGQIIDLSQSDVIVATILATSIAIIASFVQVSLYWLKNRRFEKMHIISLLIISIMGGITIFFGNPAFIQWKPTLLNWIFAAAFLGSQFMGNQSLVQRMMGAQLELPDLVWRRLNISWVIFFIISGIANLYVAFYYAIDLDEKTRMDNWVNFKLFGLLGLTFVFVIAQGIYLSRYMKDDNPKENS